MNKKRGFSLALSMAMSLLIMPPFLQYLSERFKSRTCCTG